MINKKWEAFVADNSYIKDFDKYEIIGSKILVRMFFYIPEKKTGILGLDGKPIEEDVSAMRSSKLFPLAKVIKLGTGVTETYQHLKPGDIVHLPDDITGTQVNPAWIEWMEHRDERPKVKTQAPNMLIGNITQYKPYVLVADKFKVELDKEDAFTFALPQTNIIGKYEQ